MTQPLRIRAADFAQDMPVIRQLCWEYRDHLLALGGDVRHAVETLYHADAWDELMASLPSKHARPKGIILLVELDGKTVGCGMIQPLNDADAEIKRLYIRKSAQGHGAGEKLSLALVAQARADGYERVLLDTTAVSTPARRLYEKIGFTARGPYAEMPAFIVPLMVFYELSLCIAAGDQLPA